MSTINRNPIDNISKEYICQSSHTIINKAVHHPGCLENINFDKDALQEFFRFRYNDSSFHNEYRGYWCIPCPARCHYNDSHNSAHFVKFEDFAADSPVKKELLTK